MALIRLAKLQDLRECREPKERHFLPLRPGRVRVRPHGDIRYEAPQLLDPIDEDDPGLLSFNLEGRAIPAATSPMHGRATVLVVKRSGQNFLAMVSDV